MGQVRVTLVRKAVDPRGHVVAAEDSAELVAAVQDSYENDLAYVTAISTDVSLTNARRLADLLANHFDDAFVAASGDEEGAGLVFGRVTDFDSGDLVRLAAYASEAVARRLPTLIIAMAQRLPPEEARAYYEICVKIHEERGESADYLSQFAVVGDHPVGEWTTLDSSAISAVLYTASGQLSVALTSGLTRVYFGVPYSVYSGLMEAVSAGRYYGSEIAGHYQHEVLPIEKIENFRVNSEAIESVSYDDDRQILHLRFKKKTEVLYSYHGVPKAVAMELLDADSPMRYFTDKVRDVYHTEKKAPRGGK